MNKLTRRINGHLHTQLSSSQFTYSEILNMLFPLILDMFFIQLINMLTTSMISSSSQASVSAVSLINPISTLIIYFINSVAAGGTVVVAQYKGQENAKKIHETAYHTVTVTFVIALIISFTCMICAKPIVYLLFSAAEPIVIEKSILYLAGISFSIIIFSLYAGVFAVFRGIGENKICLRLTVMINFAYLVLSLLLVNLLHLDIIGTLLALIAARMIGSAAAVYHLFIKKNRILPLRLRHMFQFNKAIFCSMLKISIPFASEQLFFYGGTIIVQAYMVLLGTETLAANAIASSLYYLIFSAPLAIGNLATTVIGQCIGAGKQDLARQYGKRMLSLGTLMIVLSALVFLPILPVLVHMFHPEPSSIPIIYRLLFITVTASPLFWSMSNVMPYVLRSAGDAVYSSIVSLITMWAIRVGAGYLLAITFQWGIYGVWVCMILEWVIRYPLFFLRFRGHRWLTKKTI